MIDSEGRIEGLEGRSEGNGTVRKGCHVDWVEGRLET